MHTSTCAILVLLLIVLCEGTRIRPQAVFEKLYHSVETGEETRRTLEANSRATYKADLAKELGERARALEIDLEPALNGGVDAERVIADMQPHLQNYLDWAKTI